MPLRSPVSHHCSADTDSSLWQNSLLNAGLSNLCNIEF